MDSIPTSTLLIALGVLIVISAYFSGSETGIMSINRYRLKHLAKENHKGALRVSKLLDRPDRLIGLILIGNNLVNIAASSIATLLGMRLFGDLGVLLSTVILTLVILIFAEVTPKTLAALYPEKISFPSSALLVPMLVIMKPFVLALNYITNGLLRLLGVKAEDTINHSLSTEELRTVINESSSMVQDHQSMVTNVLDLQDVKVEDVMVPRNEIKGIDINDDWKSIVKQITHTQHTRLLLYRDTIDDAVGFIHAKDALRLLMKDQFSKATLLRAVRELYFVPEGTNLYTQLEKFKQSKERTGIVVDEYGDIQGMVTLEDILEEVVGDFTTSSAPLSEGIYPQQDGSFLVDGSANIRELNKEMNWEFPTDGPKTLNGLILEYLEEIPQQNLSMRLADYPIEIVEVKDNKVKMARVMPLYKTDVKNKN